jgi:hypothetical protein
MNPSLSIAQVLTDLESQIAAHEERESFIPVRQPDPAVSP